MTKFDCPNCGHSLALVSSVPTPGSLGDYFGALMLEAIADMSTPVSIDQRCPHCGCDEPARTAMEAGT